ncbi:MAG: MBL fold metallo-hydrolase [bacterium]|nr:MBL fold metallo-hydrolase [bacterium]
MPKPSKLSRLTKNILVLPHYKATDRPNLAAVSGRHGTLIVDAGNSQDHAAVFLEQLSTYDVAPLRYVAVTHSHWDHVFGIARMNLPTIAHVETKKLVDEMVAWEWDDVSLNKRVEDGLDIAFCRDMINEELPDRSQLVLKAPDIIFQDVLTIDLGGVTCVVQHVGGDHTEDSTVVWVPEERVVFTGDALYMNLHDGEWHYTPEKLLPLVEKISAYNADFIVTSHDDEVLTGARMKEFRDTAFLAVDAVKRLGDNEAAIINELKEKGGSTDSLHLEIIEGLIAGLKK